MPGFDQKGPTGQGPMTGRRMGRCTNYGAGKTFSETAENENNVKSSLQEAPARGFGFGRGKGFGFGRGMRGMGRQNRFRGGF